jgi:hypothetical protein
MSISAAQLQTELYTVVDPTFAKAGVESYLEMQQRFFAGDWKPAELDGGRLCEALCRALYQLDSGVITHTDLPGKLCDLLEDFNNRHAHNLSEGDRRHFCKAIRLVYKLRSDRGPVHISPVYTANSMDSMLVLHVGKWMFAEFLRLAWNADRQLIADTIAQIVQLEHSLIHELDGKPFVLASGIAAGDEILLLLNRAPGNRLTREAIREQAPLQKPPTLNVAIGKLIAAKDVRVVADGELALTPNGQRRVIQKIIPKYSRQK